MVLAKTEPFAKEGWSALTSFLTMSYVVKTMSEERSLGDGGGKTDGNEDDGE